MCEITGRNIRKAILSFFHWDLAAGTTLTALYSALRLYRQTETADREVTVKEEDHKRWCNPAHVSEMKRLLHHRCWTVGVSSCPCCLLSEVTCVICQRCLCTHQLSCFQAIKISRTFLSATLQLSTCLSADLHSIYSNCISLIIINIAAI